MATRTYTLVGESIFLESCSIQQVSWKTRGSEVCNRQFLMSSREPVSSVHTPCTTKAGMGDTGHSSEIGERYLAALSYPCGRTHSFCEPRKSPAVHQSLLLALLRNAESSLFMRTFSHSQLPTFTRQYGTAEELPHHRSRC